MKQDITIGFLSWGRDKRLELSPNLPNERELRTLISINGQTVIMSRRDFLAALKALQMAENAGGNEPLAWRKLLVPIEGDLVQELERCVHSAVVDMPTPNHPEGKALVIGFENADYAEAAHDALQLLRNFTPPVAS